MELIKVVSAEYIDKYKVHLSFSDGLTGTVDLEGEIYGEVFEPLKDESYFKTFSRDRWTIGWDCGADFAPEFLHELTVRQSEKAHNPT